jgi:hypothetical protein
MVAMDIVEGYDHQSGVHCGAAALRNVTEYYGWHYSEAACFGIGGGPAFVLYDPPDESWVTFRTSPTWLERAFFERLGVSHSFRRGDDFETAWAHVTGHVDEDDPVLLFLDPSSLPYLSAGPSHVPPHVAVVVGYDDQTVQLSDGTMETRQEISHADLAEAWVDDRFVSLEHEYLVVNRAERTEDGTDAVAAGLRQTATYMLAPLHVKRDARGPGEEGLTALRSFGEYLDTWPDLPDADGPVRAAHRAIDEHGEGAAFRQLYADALEELGQRTGLTPALADRMAGVAREWRTVDDRLLDIAKRDDPRPGLYAEAASVVGDIADREEALFEDLAEAVGAPGGRE